MNHRIMSAGLTACIGLMACGSALAQETAAPVSTNAAPAIAEPEQSSPLTLWQRDDGSHLKATIKGEAAYYNQDNSWFGNDRGNLGGASDYWFEGVLHPGVEGSLFLDNTEIYGRLSAVYAASSSDLDAAGSNAGQGSENDLRFEDAYLGWRSGDLFSAGKDFIDVSFGRQQYVAGNGFLFYNQSSNGKDRGGYWIGERHAADYAGILTFNYEKLKTDFIYLKADDNPNTETRVGGVTVDYTDEKWGNIGGGYYNVASDINTRDSMNIYDIRGSVKPFAFMNGPELLQPLLFEGEFAHERNGDTLNANGWYASCGYEFEKLPAKPSFTYRYASFEGDDPNTSKSEDFDPLFYGFNDWGYWYQGEILGEYVLSNSNLDSHSFILKATPIDPLTMRLIYYIFDYNRASGAGVQSEDIADEIDLIADWTVTDNFSMSFVLAYANPDSGAEQAYGGNDDWLYGMIYGSISF